MILGRPIEWESHLHQRGWINYFSDTVTVCFWKVRRDIHIPVSFFTTRVKQTDEDDWGMKKSAKNLKGAKRLKLTHDQMVGGRII